MNIKISVSRFPVLNIAMVTHPPWDDIGVGGMDTLLPSAQKIHDSPNQPYKGASIPIGQNWWDYIRILNQKYSKGFEYAESVGMLWCNKYHISECVMSGGNFVAWYRNDLTCETSTHVKILSYSDLLNTGLLNPEKTDWFECPFLVWKCTAYNRAGQSFKVWNGVDSFIPQIKSRDAWMAKANLELLPKNLNYQFYGTDIWSDGEPLLIVDRYGNRVLNKLNLVTSSVNPPVGWKTL